eukprot:650827-Rhodomonas_salina.1
MAGGRCASQFKLHDKRLPFQVWLATIANISFCAGGSSVTHRFVLAYSQDIQVQSVACSRQLR